MLQSRCKCAGITITGIIVIGTTIIGVTTAGIIVGTTGTGVTTTELIRVTTPTWPSILRRPLQGNVEVAREASLCPLVSDIRKCVCHDMKRMSEPI